MLADAVKLRKRTESSPRVIRSRRLTFFPAKVQLRPPEEPCATWLHPRRWEGGRTARDETGLGQMKDDEIMVLNFLAMYPETPFARREIARKAGRRSLFEENPNWVDAPLAALVSHGLVEVNDSGQYQFKRGAKPPA